MSALQRRGPLLLLLALAFAYYRLYYRCGFIVADEGDVALRSKRILDDEQWFIQVAPACNLL
jgi:hypothetical protein